MIAQFFRYGVVGVSANLIGYCLYLLLTWLGGEPKATMTILYCFGTILAFSMHRNLTFSHQGKSLPAFMRFLAVYVAGYIVNLSGLVVGVDIFKFPHQLIQALMIGVVAVLIFGLLRFWAFPQAKTTI